MVNSDFNFQFKGGYFPQESYGETRIPLYRDAASPSKQRERNSVAFGFEEQANPGMSGKQDRARVMDASDEARLGRPKVRG
jgi:hypothetical protein